MSGLPARFVGCLLARVLGANRQALGFYDRMGYAPDGTAKDIKSATQF